MSRRAPPSTQDQGPIGALALVTALLLAGEAVAGLASLPVPGVALAFLALAAWLAARGGPTPALDALFAATAPGTSLFCVPAVAGIALHLDLLASFWLPVLLTVLAGTAAVLLGAGLVMQAILRRVRRAA